MDIHAGAFPPRHAYRMSCWPSGPEPHNVDTNSDVHLPANTITSSIAVVTNVNMTTTPLRLRLTTTTTTAIAAGTERTATITRFYTKLLSFDWAST